MAVQLHEHIYFGELLNSDVFPQGGDNYKIPPPEYSFGTFLSTENVDSLEDLEMVYETYQNTLNYPMEGFTLGLSDLDDYDSLTFNTTRYDLNDTYEFMF